MAGSAGMLAVLAALWAGGLELLYPPQANCLGCGSPVGADVGYLCAECADLLVPLSRLSAARCQRCGRLTRGRKRCLTCHKWPAKGLSFARYAYVYGRPIRGLIANFKYAGTHRLSALLGRLLTNAFIADAFDRPDVLVPVPMHRSREQARGFNHAAWLAEALSGATGIPMLSGALVRVRNTRQQAKIASARRGQVLAGAFQATDAVKGLRVLLVDDVLTSGDTANHCAEVLRLAGAKDVQLIALAGPGRPNAPKRRESIQK